MDRRLVSWDGPVYLLAVKQTVSVGSAAPVCAVYVYTIYIYIYTRCYIHLDIWRKERKRKKRCSAYMLWEYRCRFIFLLTSISLVSPTFHRCCPQARSSSPCSSSSCISVHSSSIFFSYFVHNFFSFIFFLSCFKCTDLVVRSRRHRSWNDIRTCIYTYKSTHTQRRERRKSTRVCVRSRWVRVKV